MDIVQDHDIPDETEISPLHQDSIALEAMLIEQEHRFFRVFSCFFRRKKWNKNDPRRHAAKMAVLYSVFSFRTVAAGGAAGAIFAFAGIAIQAKMMAEQNKLIASQLYESREQWLFEYRQSLFKTLYGKEGCGLGTKRVAHVLRRTDGVVNVEYVDEDPCLVASARSRAEAAVSLYSLEIERLNKSCSKQLGQQSCRPDFSGVDLSLSGLQGQDFSEASFSEAKLNRVNLSNAYLTGALFVDAKLSSSKLIGVKAKNCEFRLTPMSKSFLYGGDFSGCKFLDSEMTEVCFMGANLQGAEFRSVNLLNAKFHYSDLTGAKFNGVLDLEPSQLKFACSDGGTELPFDFVLLPCKKSKVLLNHVDEQLGIDKCLTPVK